MARPTHRSGLILVILGMMVAIMTVSSIQAQQTKKDGDPNKKAADRMRVILAHLDQKIGMPFENEVPLIDILNYINVATQDPALPHGLPIYIDAVALHSARVSTDSKVAFAREEITAKKALEGVLLPLNLEFVVKDGLVLIEGPTSRARRGEPAK